jgi:type IV pilus assembly protein PilN
MIRVNLLPHREMKRAAQQRSFVIAAAVMVMIGVGVIVAFHGVLAARIDEQRARNKFLDEQVAAVDKQIVDIQRLRDQTQQLLARKRVVETLQLNRSDAVQIFDQLSRQLPDGVYLRTIKQTGTRVSIVGYAQSNSRVSTLIDNLRESSLFGKATLIEIKAAMVAGQRLNEFSLNVDITRQSAAPADAPPTRSAPARK